MRKVKNLGQVFTPDFISEKMLSLSENVGNILEPSSGENHIVNFLKKNTERHIVSVEIDPDLCNSETINIDFFDYGLENKFPTIISNPPYVSHKNISKSTKNKISKLSYLNDFDNRTNLYIFFIKKCIMHLEDNGEMIMITPREFINQTSSIPLNDYIFKNGTITHWFEYGDDIVFKGYNPNVVVWRFKKNLFNYKTITNDGIKSSFLNSGQIIFSDKNFNVKFSDLFLVKVGAVSGCDSVFENEHGNMEFVCSYTRTNGKLKKMFFNVENEYLLKNKNTLLKRGIKKFNEKNWYTWGRYHYISDDNRIYVNCKTRKDKPFFLSECKNYDGSILAIFPKNKNIKIENMRDMLNDVDWSIIGFRVGGRYTFNQKSLQNCYLPENFKIFL